MSQKPRNTPGFGRKWQKYCHSKDLNDSRIPCVCISSPFFLLKVPRGHQAGAYDSLQAQKCPRCSHYGPIKAYTCHDCRSNATCPHAEGGVAVKVGHVVDSCGSAHQMSCHGAVRCHWPHGSNKGGTQKSTQHHVVTVRCVWNSDWRTVEIDESAVIRALNSSFIGLFVMGHLSQ